jgi:hypothetical protein
VTKLPKRFHERPRKQDVYSKRDWERHPSHAPPYGFGTAMPSCVTFERDTSTDSPARDAPKRKRRAGSVRKRDESAAFVPLLFPCTFLTKLRTPLLDCARRPALSLPPPRRALHARFCERSRSVLMSGTNGARNNGADEATGGKIMQAFYCRSKRCACVPACALSGNAARGFCARAWASTGPAAFLNVS